MPELGDLSLSRLCNYTWYMMTRNAQDDREVQQIRTKLWRPPQGAPAESIPAESPWSPENETKALTALKQGLGGTTQKTGPMQQSVEQ